MKLLCKKGGYDVVLDACNGSVSVKARRGGWDDSGVSEEVYASCQMTRASVEEALSKVLREINERKSADTAVAKRRRQFEIEATAAIEFVKNYEVSEVREVEDE